MDLSLEVSRSSTQARPLLSFNPCFHGSLSGSVWQWIYPYITIKFQSLFSWISLWKWDITNSYIIFSLVSILVFMDLSLEAAVAAASPDGDRVSILVFMDLSLEV